MTPNKPERNPQFGSICLSVFRSNSIARGGKFSIHCPGPHTTEFGGIARNGNGRFLERSGIYCPCISSWDVSHWTHPLSGFRRLFLHPPPPERQVPAMHRKCLV